MPLSSKTICYEQKVKGKKGMTEPSGLGNVKKLHTIFDRAIVDGLLEKNPFETFKLKGKLVA